MLPLAQGCNDHKEHGPPVNKESWTPGSETACCKAGSACMLKMKIPVKKNGAAHQGHQCSLCDEHHHNICMIPAASTTNDCGCGPSSSSESATVTPTGKGKGPAPKEGSEGSHSNLRSGASQNTKGIARQLKTSLNVRARATCSTINRIVDKETSVGRKIQALIKPAGGGRTLVHGTVESGNSSASWGVRWDFAGPDDELPRHKRADLSVMGKGATETAGLDDAEEEMSSLPSEGDVINGVPGLDGLSFDQLRALKEVKLWHKDRGVLGETHPDAHTRWTIHADGEVVDVGDLPPAFDRGQSRLSAGFDPGQDLLKTFFESTFPPVEGHGKKDEKFSPWGGAPPSGFSPGSACCQSQGGAPNTPQIASVRTQTCSQLPPWPPQSLRPLALGPPARPNRRLLAHSWHSSTTTGQTSRRRSTPMRPVR